MATRQGYTVARAAMALNLHDSQLRSWLDRMAPDWRTARGGLMDEPESDNPKTLRMPLQALPISTPYHPTCLTVQSSIAQCRAAPKTTTPGTSLAACAAAG